MNYQYKAKVVSVYDADTITVDLDLGFHITIKDQKIRLYGINAPEVKGDERELGLIARDDLRKQILGKEVILHTYKDKQGKYGRWLATVYKDGVDMNAYLIERGFARTNYYK